MSPSAFVAPSRAPAAPTAWPEPAEALAFAIGPLESEPEPQAPPVTARAGPGVTVAVHGFPVELRDDLDELQATVASAYVLGGSSLVWTIGEEIARQRWRPREQAKGMLPPRPSAGWRLQAPMSVLDPVTRLHGRFGEAQRRVYAELATQLREVEKTAAELISDRLEVSRAQIRAEAARYLTGCDLDEVFADPVEARFPEQTAFRDGPDKDELFGFLSVIARAEAQAAQARAFERLADDPRADVLPLFDAPPEGVDAHERRSRLIADAGRRAPLVHWLSRKDPRRRDEQAVLQDVIGELSTAWRSAHVVAQRIERTPAKTLQAGPDSPAVQLAARLAVKEARGPWRYPAMIAAALEEHALRETSVAATGAYEALENADGTLAEGLLEAGGWIALLVALHFIDPPLAIAADIVLGAWQVYEELSEHQRQIEDYRAILDPADAIARPPSAAGVVASLVQALPFVKWYAQAGAAVLPVLLPEGAE